jgi:hypothetical protein
MGGPGERPCGGLAAPFAIDVAMGVDTKDLFMARQISAVGAFLADAANNGSQAADGPRRGGRDPIGGDQQ